ncbi:SDR family NAD(P)-dependent oxidoreductase [Acidovorax sp.]|uniref:SDR family NAD(P)-dependent oxidoreductase n=1 Tax=Acidovorax sp. TaxID=1872122 RepID=UPI0040382860
MKTHDLFNVKGLTVAITGGASGIGFAYAEALASNGAQVILIDVDSEALAAAVDKLGRDGSEVHAELADVTQPHSLRQAINAVIAQHGRLDVMFANAGISAGPGFLRSNGERNPDGEVENLSLDLWQRVLSTNVTSVLLSLQLVVPQMKKQGGGRFIATSSISASIAETLVSSLYATSKGAVSHMVRQYALELARYNILVNAISPGPVVTNIGGGRLKSADARRPFEQAAPLGRIAEPQDLQGAALFLASPASSLITGTEIVIDGGRILGKAD